MKTAYFLLAILVLSCKSPESKTNELISPVTAAEKLKSDPSIVVLDVRTPGELQSGMIAGAKHLDFNAGDFQKALDSLDRNKTYYMYCAGGGRSGRAQKMMKEKGFENASSIDGGLKAWTAAGLPLTKP